MKGLIRVNAPLPDPVGIPQEAAARVVGLTLPFIHHESSWYTVPLPSFLDILGGADKAAADLYRDGARKLSCISVPAEACTELQPTTELYLTLKNAKHAAVSAEKYELAGALRDQMAFLDPVVALEQP